MRVSYQKLMFRITRTMPIISRERERETEGVLFLSQYQYPPLRKRKLRKGERRHHKMFEVRANDHTSLQAMIRDHLQHKHACSLWWHITVSVLVQPPVPFLQTNYSGRRWDEEEKPSLWNVCTPTLKNSPITKPNCRPILSMGRAGPHGGPAGKRGVKP